MTSSARSSSVGLIVKPSVRSTASPIRHTWHLGWDGCRESSRSELLAACAIQRLPCRPPRRVHGMRSHTVPVALAADAGPRVEPGAERPWGAVVGRHGACGESDGCPEELAALVHHWASASPPSCCWVSTGTAWLATRKRWISCTAARDVPIWSRY